MAAAVVLVLLTTGYLMVRNTRLELERSLAQEDREQVIATLTGKLDHLAEVTAQRQLAKTRKDFLEHFTTEHGIIKNLLVALSHYVPDNMTLYNLNLDHDNGNLTEIIGQIEGAGIADSDQTFNIFYNRLKSSGLFDEVSDPDLSTRLENGAYILSFKIDCKLKV